MHIGIDATALYGRYNGVEYALWNGLKALCGLGSRHFFSVWIPADGPDLPQLAGFGPRWRWKRLPFRGAARARRIAWQQLELPRLLTREACNVLYSPTYVAPLRCPVPVVLNVYDVIALESPELATAANRWHYGAVLPRALRQAARVIVPAPVVAEAVVRRGAKHVSVVPIGVEPEFRPRPPWDIVPVLRRHGLPAEYLLYVGNREPKKNLPRLLEALELVAQQRSVPPLVIAGEARPWGEDLVPSTTVSVRRLGYVPRDELPLLMAGCTAFLFPSLAEGYGLPVLEALSCGAPVVASTAVPIPGLVDVAMLCDPQDPWSIAAAVERVLADTPLRRELSGRAENFSAGFSTALTARRVLELLEEAASATGPYFANEPSGGTSARRDRC